MHWGLADIAPAYGKQSGVSEWGKAGRREAETDGAAGPEAQTEALVAVGWSSGV